ncbi:MAG: tetratricopeptide repeat protein [Methylohalobius sp.]|nr:tetratricopeptide repeat protein [Methylohalobius sp.]
MSLSKLLSLPRLRPGFLFVGAALLAILAYWPGLWGGFYFDDFAQIVLNPFIQLKELTFGGLWAAMHSSVSGPTGRPLAMASFALDHALFGLNPWPMKLINVGIHLLNGVLLWGLLRRLVLRFPGLEPSSKWLADATVFLWLIHPLHVSTVLYVVQRMTLLASSFMLLGLLGYCHFRCHTRPRMALALGSLFAATGLAVLAKENGVLALAYAALIEVWALRFDGLDIKSSHLARVLFLWLPLVGGVSLVGYWFCDPDWFARAYAGRDFNCLERLMTEARVLVFYQYLIALPDLSAMGLYHDDWTISKSLLDPPVTLLALLWHSLLLGLALRLRRSLPLVSFGILWFYAGHLLESTFLPLELVFEHRNYLAAAGVFLALFGLVAQLAARLPAAPAPSKPMFWIFGFLAPLLWTTTWIRAADWGDLFSHGIMEATRHPTSARSQFEAGQTLAQGIMRHPELAKAYYLQAREHYWAAARLDARGLAPLVSLMALDTAIKHEIDQKVLAELQYRLRHAKPDASAQINLHALTHQILNDTQRLFDQATALSLFDAALANPHLGSRERAEVLVSKALYLNGQHREAEALSALEQAVAWMPHRLDALVLLAAKQIDLGLIAEAKNTLAQAEGQDRFGTAAEEIARLKRQVSP